MFNNEWTKRFILLILAYLLYVWSWNHTVFALEPVTVQGQQITNSQFEEQLRKHIRVNTEGPNFIGHILIDDRTSGINESTWIYVKKALDSYKDEKKRKPIFIILELNTPGGEVYAAQKISDALKELDIQNNIPVVTFINNWAISAGAMIAYSTRFIIPTKDASMGAAEPVIQDETGKMASASEKINSAIRADFANRAHFFDRDPSIAEAMVDKDIILVRREGKIIKLDSESQIRTGQDADILISPRGKLLTLSSDQMLAYGVADAIVPPTKTQPLTTQEQESGLWDAQKMAIFHLPFFKDIPNAIIESYRMDWKTQFFVYLAHPVVSSLLFLGLILGFYLEMNSPGLGLPAGVALTCLFLIVLSSFSLEVANWLELILLLVGIAIILVELFVLPTFGILGVVGLIFFIIGLFGMMLPGISSVDFEFDTSTFNAAGEAFIKKLAWLSGTFALAAVIIGLLARYFTPSFAKFSRLVLNGNEQNGYIAGDNPIDLPQPGSKGKVFSTLRPAGKVIINESLYEAMSDGSFIEKGESIVVDHLDGSVIIVIKEAEENSK